MARTHLLHGAAVAALLMAAPLGAGSAFAQSQTTVTQTTTTEVTVESLRQRLRPLGEYVRVEGLGEVWKPRQVDAEWQPYSRGRWIFNAKVGWYFESDEPWAEIVYHYGRWYEDPDQGWVWVADTQWAPAWVEWRRGKGYVGWRPLPPQNAPKRSITRTMRTTTTRHPGRTTEVTEEWVFVPAERIVSERIETVRVRREQVVEVYRETRPIGSVERRGAVAVNFALQPQVIERETHITITSQNLPRPEAAPVPAAVRDISTEQRTTTTTTTTSPGPVPAPGQPAAGTPASAAPPSPSEPAKASGAQPTTGTGQPAQSPSAAGTAPAKPGNAAPAKPAPGEAHPAAAKPAAAGAPPAEKPGAAAATKPAPSAAPAKPAPGEAHPAAAKPAAAGSPPAEKPGDAGRKASPATAAEPASRPGKPEADTKSQ